MTDASGAAMFARYAHPPNELGYCGPDDFAAAASGGDGTGEAIAGQARKFDGAWPYLQVIARASGVDDPMDHRVVEAYWLGNDLLDNVDPGQFSAVLDESFRGQPLAHRISPVAGLTAVPHHNFHVFAVYPWVRLLADHRSGTALEVLDRCRIRWGQVLFIQGPEATVRCRRLDWDGRSLGLGKAEAERVVWSSDTWTPLGSLHPGDWVSMHWGWICDRLSAAQVAALRSFSARQLVITNHTAAWRLRHGD